MSDTIGNLLIVSGMVFFLVFVVAMGCSFIAFADVTAHHREVYGLGATLTTTDDYEALTNDSFTGVVVGGDCVWDQSLTLLNRDGVERVIALDFLEPVE